MVNIVVTTTTNLIKVEFNDLADIVEHIKGTWRKDRILFIKLNAGAVVIKFMNGRLWEVSYNGENGTLPIDSIDGVPLSSNSDLYNKLISVME